MRNLHPHRLRAAHLTAEVEILAAQLVCAIGLISFPFVIPAVAETGTLEKHIVRYNARGT